MLYNAPITDYVVKSTFKLRIPFSLISASNAYDTIGVQVSAAGNLVNYQYPVLQDIFTLDNLIIAMLSGSTLPSMLVDFKLYKRSDGVASAQVVDSISNVDIGPTTVNTNVYYDFAANGDISVNLDDMHFISIVYNAGPGATNVRVTGVWGVFSLA